MSGAQAGSELATQMKSPGTVEMKLEVLAIPVSRRRAVARFR